MARALTFLLDELNDQIAALGYQPDQNLRQSDQNLHADLANPRSSIRTRIEFWLPPSRLAAAWREQHRSIQMSMPVPCQLSHWLLPNRKPPEGRLLNLDPIR